MINDAFKNDYGANAVRYSQLSAAVTTMLGALLFVWAAGNIHIREMRDQKVTCAESRSEMRC